MTGREIIRQIMDASGISNAELAHRLGLTIATAWDRVNTRKLKDVSVSVLAETVGAMGFKVAVIPQEAEIPEGGYLVNGAGGSTADQT